MAENQEHHFGEINNIIENSPFQINQKQEKGPCHYMFVDDKLAVSHAGLKQEYMGKESPKIRAFCKYGETTGEVDEFGLPIRYPWAQNYQGDTLIVYGHTPVSDIEWVNNAINIDTGCVFGGRLTAFRYPERQFLSVQASRVYCEPINTMGSGKEN
jgi:protein phosphatase